MFIAPFLNSSAAKLVLLYLGKTSTGKLIKISSNSHTYNYVDSVTYLEFLAWWSEFSAVCKLRATDSAMSGVMSEDILHPPFSRESPVNKRLRQ